MVYLINKIECVFCGKSSVYNGMAVQERRTSMEKREVWDEMIETDKILGMIRQKGAEYFSVSGEGKAKIEVGIYLEQLMEEKGITRKEMVRRLNLDESY